MDPASSPPRFDGVADVLTRLGEVGYLADDDIATVVHLADRLDKPLLVEGPAGVGKTELSKAIARALALPLIRLQCYEGVDETKTLYEWNYRKQLLRIQAGPDDGWGALSEDIFSEDFLLERPVLKAIRSAEPVVLLIDEIDKLDFEAEALLLEVLSDWQVTIPEMGTIAALKKPLVVLTSNNERELSEALKRRCLYLHVGYPDAERELSIIRRSVPGLPEALAAQVVRIVQTLRELELKKAPSIAESIDWARTLIELAIEDIDEAVLRTTLPVLLKYESDLQKAATHLRVGRTAR
ncbi:MAG TPA: MoxR family ATPase [Actinomycetota bacterium]|nr:MoxR family ATPase [Actinomycetota bacterium]